MRVGIGEEPAENVVVHFAVGVVEVYAVILFVKAMAPWRGRVSQIPWSSRK